ncbi:MAG: hypothetical protein OEZ58_06985 [Gammaproteobacteria bacterium]|nr:hypothetical protein [Gammaproteobacteria bacterium]
MKPQTIPYLTMLLVMTLLFNSCTGPADSPALSTQTAKLSTQACDAVSNNNHFLAITTENHQSILKLAYGNLFVGSILSFSPSSNFAANVDQGSGADEQACAGGGSMIKKWQAMNFGTTQHHAGDFSGTEWKACKLGSLEFNGESTTRIVNNYDAADLEATAVCNSACSFEYDYAIDQLQISDSTTNIITTQQALFHYKIDKDANGVSKNLNNSSYCVVTDKGIASKTKFHSMQSHYTYTSGTYEGSVNAEMDTLVIGGKINIEANYSGEYDFWFGTAGTGGKPQFSVSLSINGAANSSVSIEADQDQLLISYDADGDGFADAPPVTTTWLAFLLSST